MDYKNSHCLHQRGAIVKVMSDLFADQSKEIIKWSTIDEHLKSLQERKLDINNLSGGDQRRQVTYSISKAKIALVDHSTRIC